MDRGFKESLKMGLGMVKEYIMIRSLIVNLWSFILKERLRKGNKLAM
jgi:hypothetical protein